VIKVGIPFVAVLTFTEENRLKIRQLGGLLPLLYLIMPNVSTAIVRQASGLLHYLSADGKAIT
jgi:hypothetical protein